MEQLIFPVTKKTAEKQNGTFSSEANKNALFPTQLRELRKEKGVSQEQLSKDIGVSKSTIGLYETGDTLPDAKTLRDLAVYFGVSADYLLGLSPVATQNVDFRKVCEYTGLSEKAISIIREWSYEDENNGNQTLTDILSEIIEDPDFLQIIGGFAIACNAQLLSSEENQLAIDQFEKEHMDELASIGAIMLPAGHAADLAMHQVEYRFSNMLYRHLAQYTSK